LSETTVVSFDYVNVSEISPDRKFEPIPAGTPLRVKVLAAAKKDFEYKPGNKKGVEPGTVGNYLKFDLAVSEGEYTGRRIFPTLFPSDFTLRALARLAQRTGVQQEFGEGIEDWLKKLSEQQPEFKTLATVYTRKAQDGSDSSENDIDWKQILPAD
jgi:hypothetical protein